MVAMSRLSSLGLLSVQWVTAQNPPQHSLAELLDSPMNSVGSTAAEAPTPSPFAEDVNTAEEVMPETSSDVQSATPELCQELERFHQEVFESSPFLRYVKHFDRWLKESSYQVSIAFGALLCGGLCSWNGPKLWEVIVISCFSLAAAWLVRFEAEQRQLAPNVLAEILLMLAAGCTVALAVQSGFEGSQVLIGSLLGFLAAVYCGLANWAQSADGALHGLALTWYLSCSAFGIWIFTSWRQPLLATLAPLTGSFLVISGLGFLLSRGLDLSMLPRQDESFSAGAMVLLGPLGLHALPWHGACALLAASLHTCRRQGLAVMVLVGYVLLVALGGLVAGLECKNGKRSDGTNCPKALAVVGQWQWQLLGCSLWAMLAAFCGHRQLSALKHGPRRSVGYVPVEEAMESQVPPHRSETADPFVTRWPQGYGPPKYQPGGLYKYVKSRH